MRSRISKKLIYFVPIVGTIKLLKRIQRLERQLEGVTSNDSILAELYESRIQKIYDKVTDLLAEGKLKV